MNGGVVAWRPSSDVLQPTSGGLLVQKTGSKRRRHVARPLPLSLPGRIAAASRALKSAPAASRGSRLQPDTDYRFARNPCNESASTRCAQCDPPKECASSRSSPI